MPSCPVCRVPLRTIRQREGIYFACDQCHGRAVTIPQIRRVAGNRFATQLFHEITQATDVSPRICPFCSGAMRQFRNANPPLTLEACRPCGLVWFDPAEFEAIPEGVVETPDELTLRGREALALEKVKQIAADAHDSTDIPEEKWKWVVAFLGMPVELEAPGLSRVPWLTWSLAGLIALISVLTFPHLDDVVARYGLIPAHAWRSGGLTFISSFFLHGGWWHLLPNLYFFLVFGDNVEDYLGRWKFALLILTSSLGGDVLAILLQPHSTIPSIGASGGIAGVLVFYALEFPRVRLAFLLWLSWLAIPAWGALVLWLLLQIATAVLQVSGLSSISGLAHLGGAVAGWLWWLKWGRDAQPRVAAVAHT